MSEISVGVASVGFFGKMPARGDFVGGGLPDEFIDPWDRWLQEVIAYGLSEFNETWLDSYLTAPIWRFYLAAGAVSPDPWVGVIMPSVDSVNRYFPLSIIARAANLDPFAAMTRLTSWYEAAETTVLQALEQDDLEVTELEEQVALLPAVVGEERKTNPQTVWSSQNAVAVTVPKSMGAAELQLAFSDILLAKSFDTPVAFWCVDDAAQHFRLLNVLGLPVADYQWMFGCVEPESDRFEDSEPAQE